MIPLQVGEKILFEVRKHWLNIVVHAIVLFILAAFLLIIVPVLVVYFSPSITNNPGFQGALSFFGVAWLWFVWVMFFVMWTNYYLDVLVITNKRFIDMEQFALFSRDEVIVPLDQIEDIKIEVKGVLATLLRYGNLQIQTAGAQRETVVKNIMRPAAVHARIMHAKENQKNGI